MIDRAVAVRPSRCRGRSARACKDGSALCWCRSSRSSPSRFAPSGRWPASSSGSSRLRAPGGGARSLQQDRGFPSGGRRSPRSPPTQASRPYRRGDRPLRPRHVRRAREPPRPAAAAPDCLLHRRRRRA
jgi:hypothetical protein